MPPAEPENFGAIVARIVMAVVAGRAALRGHFSDPAGFDPLDPHTGARRAIEAVYRELCKSEGT